MAAAAVFRPLAWILAATLAASAVAFALYGWDKAAAKGGRRRVPERALHGVALLGGWPGAAVAQAAFRHKTQKEPFRRAFLATVALNVLLTVAVGACTAAGLGFAAPNR